MKFSATLGGVIEKPLNAGALGLIQVVLAKPLHPVYKAWSIVMDGHSYFLFTDTTFTNEENLCCCTLDRIRSLSFIGCHLITTFVT